MNTPKPFNPVVPLPRPVAYIEIKEAPEGVEHDKDIDLLFLWPGLQLPDGAGPLYTLAQLREYAASVARECVVAPRYITEHDNACEQSRVRMWNDCRAEMLARIEAYVGEGK